MKKFMKHLGALLVVVFVLSTVSFGATDTLTMKEAYGKIKGDKGKNCYIFGKLQMVHTTDPSIGEESITSTSENLTIFPALVLTLSW